MLNIFADTFMIATRNPHTDVLPRQPSYGWYQAWHRFALFLKGQ